MKSLLIIQSFKNSIEVGSITFWIRNDMNNDFISILAIFSWIVSLW